MSIIKTHKKCKLSKTQKSLLILFFLCIALSIIFQSKVTKSLTDGNFIFMTLLNGLTGGFLSGCIVLYGFGENTDTKKIDNQLKLRKMFSEERRWNIHVTLETGDVSYWYKAASEKPEIEWKESNAFKNHFLPALDDYMGLFEVAYLMMKEDQLSEEYFKISYLYRLENIAALKCVKEKLEETEKEYWNEVKNLLEMFDVKTQVLSDNEKLNKVRSASIDTKKA